MGVEYSDDPRKCFLNTIRSTPVDRGADGSVRRIAARHTKNWRARTVGPREFDGRGAYQRQDATAKKVSTGR
jgi:hypothetical protein